MLFIIYMTLRPERKGTTLCLPPSVVAARIAGTTHLLEEFGVASSLLLRVRFARFTNVFSLAMEDLVSLLGGVVFATLVGLGTSSFG
jgi:hypothetical protein